MVDVAAEELSDRLSVAYKKGETTGSVHVDVQIDGETVHSSVVKAAAEDSHHGNTERGKFLNNLKSHVESSDYDVKAGVVRAQVEAWFEDLQDGNTELDSDLRSPLANEIIEGTQTPVEIHAAADNSTVFVVTLRFRGRMNEIEFAADDLLPGSSPGPLESALMNQYYERVDVPDEDWEEIATYWHDNSEVVTVTETTADGARAERVLEYLTDGLKPTSRQMDLNNSHQAAWVDADGEETKSGEPVVWVQDRHYVDQIDSVASVDAKKDICKELRKRDDLIEKTRRRSWLDTDGRDTFWAFDPSALGVDPGHFDTGDDAQEGVEV